MVSVKWAQRVLLEDIRADNDIPAKALNKSLWGRYRVQMTKSTLYRMKSKALVDIHGGMISLIGIDETFLNGNYGGVLLSVVAVDGNNEIFPVAWANVSSEDDECWSFFIHNLKSSIEKACKDLWPEVDRRYCCNHLSVNFKQAFPSPKMWQLFWLAASATSPFVFQKAMKQIDKAKPSARVWLANIGEQSRWTKHKFDPLIKCDVNNTNFVESFNQH
ncbi:Transaldolase [Bienertia sinuspersici]